MNASEIHHSSYDHFGRLIQTRDALGAVSSIEYDANGRPAKLTDRKGQVTQLSYNERGQTKLISNAERSIGIQYDAVGRISEVRDAQSVNSYQWDNAERIVQIDSSTAAGSHRLSYQWDSLDRLSQRSLSGSGISGTEVTRYEWDLAGRLLGHSTEVGGQTQSTRYQYDDAGRLSQRSHQAGSGAVIAQRYGWDKLERLARIQYLKDPGGSAEQLLEQIDYQYDALGQRTGRTTLNGSGSGNADTAMSASYDSANRMSAITLNPGGTNSSSYTLSYDAQGNLTAKQNSANAQDATSYQWDAQNKLVKLTRPELTASFTYDAFGRRIQSSITPAGQAPATVQYIYEDQQALGEIRDGKLSHRLLSGLSLDESIARVALTSAGAADSTRSRTFATDALNSVIAQFNEDGSVSNGYSYSPYGETAVQGADETKNPVQYTSRENDGTGLYYYRARFYDPVLKRFTQSDPIGLAGGNHLRICRGQPRQQHRS